MPRGVPSNKAGHEGAVSAIVKTLRGFSSDARKIVLSLVSSALAQEQPKAKKKYNKKPAAPAQDTTEGQEPAEAGEARAPKAASKSKKKKGKAKKSKAKSKRRPGASTAQNDQQDQGGGDVETDPGTGEG